MQSWLKSMLFGYALLVCVWCWNLGIFLVGMIYHWNDIFAVRFRVLTCQCSSISSINQISASNSECKGYNCLSWFLKPRSCSSSDTSTIPNHIHCNVSLKFTIHLQICCKHKAMHVLCLDLWMGIFRVLWVCINPCMTFTFSMYY